MSLSYGKSGESEQLSFGGHPARTQVEIRNGPALWLLLIILISSLIYVPNLGDSLLCLDLMSYKYVMESVNALETAYNLFADFSGKLVGGYYAPLSSISLMLDKFLAGSNVPIPKLTFFINWLLHCLNGILLYYLLLSVNMSRLGALIACYVFILHPIQIPSILWLIERKTVLAGALYILSYLMYIRGRTNDSRSYFAISLICFLLGLLSKPTVVTLPIVLFAWEMLYTRPAASGSRVNQDHSGTGEPNRNRITATLMSIADKKMLLSLAPFFLIALIWGIITIVVEDAHSVNLPLWKRPFVVSAAVFFYLGKFFAPLNIVTLYPKWNIDPGNPLWWTPLIVLLCLISAGLAARKSLDNRFWWGIVNFIAPLAPVVGIVPFGWFQASYVGLHLMYLSMIGLSCCVGMFFTTVWGRTTGVLKKVTVALGCLWLLILPALGFYHAQIWSDQLSLWEVNKKVYPKNPVVLNMLGLAEMAAGKYRAAEENFHQAITHDPKHWRAHLNLGLSLLNQDMLEDAEQSLRRAIELNPKSYGAYIGLAQAHKKRGNFEKTRQSLQKAIELGAKEPKTYNDLGNLMLGAGRIDQALRLFKEAIDLNPLAAQPYNNLGAAFMSKNLPSQALEAFEKAISLKPGYAMAHANAGFACLSLKRPNCAVTHLKMALELDPTLERAKHHLRRITKTKGRP